MPTTERNTIAINGVIVPSVYDDEWFEDYIDKGLITPLSRVEKQLKSADPEKPLNVRINSGGGSVFSGHEMLNAIVDWRNANGQAVNVEVGAMAASAASTIAVMLGPVRAHENTLFMFHGATSVAEGQRGEMLDTAELLDRINAQVVQKLVNKYWMDPDQVGEWFSDGRTGWMDAQEAKTAGLVDIVIPSESEPIDLTESNVEDMTKQGLDVAAMLEIETEHGDEEMNEIMDKLKVMIGIETDGQKPEDVAQALDEYADKQKQAVDTAYDEGLNANVEEKVKAKVEQIEADCKTKVEEAEAEAKKADEAKAEAEKAQSEMRDKLKKAEARLKTLDKGFRNSSGENHEYTSYWEVVKDLEDDGMSKERAMLTAQREHPDLHQAMLNEKK